MVNPIWVIRHVDDEVRGRVQGSVTAIAAAVDLGAGVNGQEQQQRGAEFRQCFHGELTIPIWPNDGKHGDRKQAPFPDLFRIRNSFFPKLTGVPDSLESQLGHFLKERRGEQTYAQFSRKIGFPPSTLHRLEQGSQSITLRGLQQILRKLKCSLGEIFPEDFKN